MPGSNDNVKKIGGLTALFLVCLFLWRMGGEPGASEAVSQLRSTLSTGVESIRAIGRVAAALDVSGPEDVAKIVSALGEPPGFSRVEWVPSPPGKLIGEPVREAAVAVSRVTKEEGDETWVLVPLPGRGYVGGRLAIGPIASTISDESGGVDLSILDVTGTETLFVHSTAPGDVSDPRPIAAAERLSLETVNWLIEARAPAARPGSLARRMAIAFLVGLSLVFAASVAAALSRYLRAIADSRSLVRGSPQSLDEELSRSKSELERARRDAFEHALIFDSMPAMIWVKDRHNRILRANRAATDSVGMPPGSLDGKSTFDLYPEHAQKYFEDDLEVISSNRPKLGILERYEGSDRSLWVRTDKIPFPGMDGQCAGVVVFAIDITEHKLAEERLNKLASELERSNKELEQFAFVSSHDLQEPLRTIHNYARLLENRCPDGDMSSKRMLKSIVDASGRAYDLISDILRYARMNAVERPTAMISSELILKQALVGLSGTIREKSAVIRYESLPYVVVNETYAQQLFQNLLANALKFNNRPAPAIHIRAERREERWMFSIEDNGPGIPESEWERIFEIFQRGSTAVPSGTGLGLALCKKIVEFHGGSIWVESKPGKGACFNFTLPAASEISTEEAA